MKKKIIDLLIELGIPVNCVGFQYIIDFVCLLQNPDWRHVKIMSIYGKVARMNNTKIQRIERGIRYAFECAYKNSSDENIEKYLSKSNKTNGNLLYLLYYRLTQEE